MSGSPRRSYHLELLGGMGEAQHALHAGHFSTDRREGEALEERCKEKEQLHSGQLLPYTHTFTCGGNSSFIRFLTHVLRE